MTPSQPATAAGRALLKEEGRGGAGWADAILAIEREAAAPLRAVLERLVDAWDDPIDAATRYAPELRELFDEARAALAEPPTGGTDQ